jgi:hypothetical protein
MEVDAKEIERHTHRERVRWSNYTGNGMVVILWRVQKLITPTRRSPQEESRQQFLLLKWDSTASNCRCWTKSLLEEEAWARAFSKIHNGEGLQFAPPPPESTCKLLEQASSPVSGEHLFSRLFHKFPLFFFFFPSL